MQRQKQRASARSPKSNKSADLGYVDTARGTADRLFRLATECARQRERYSRLVAAGAHEDEQLAALRVACLCDDQLFACAKAYEQMAQASSPQRTDDWWHTANQLWHACREYQRRHRNCDERSRQLLSHKADKLKELALEYDLEASALLALKMATSAYRKGCPDCDMDRSPQTFVA